MIRLILAMFLLVCACDASREPLTPAAVSTPESPPSDTDGQPAGESDSAQSDLPAELPVGAAERMVIRTAELRLRTERPEGLIGEANRLATNAGGFLVSSTTTAISDSVTEVSIQLRVQADKFDAVLDLLRAGGSVMQESINGQDVTEEFVDVQARLRTFRQLEERFLKISEGTGKVEDLLAVEHELARVRGNIDRLEGRSLYLRDRARLSTIHVVARSPEQPQIAAVQSFTSRIGNAFVRGWEVCVSTMEAAIVVAVGLMPPGVCVAACFLWYRRRRSVVA